MTGAEIMAVVGFGILVAGVVSGAFWRMWGLIKEAGGKGETAQRELLDHKLHVAETYVTKAGMSEQTAQIMKAIDGVGSKIDRTNERLDGFLQPRPRSRSQ